MHGSAKYSTKVFSPGMAASGSTPRRVAMKPHSTRAKKGKVTARMDSTVGDCGSSARTFAYTAYAQATSVAVCKLLAHAGKARAPRGTGWACV